MGITNQNEDKERVGMNIETRKRNKTLGVEYEDNDGTYNNINEAKDTVSFVCFTFHGSSCHQMQALLM